MVSSLATKRGRGALHRDDGSFDLRVGVLPSAPDLGPAPDPQAVTGRIKESETMVAGIICRQDSRGVMRGAEKKKKRKKSDRE